MSRLTIILPCAGVLLCAGLMGSALAADSGGQAATAAPAGPDKVIADILTVSGLNAGFAKMAKSFADDFHKGLQEAQGKRGQALPPDLQQALEASVRESLTAKGFATRVTRALKQDYDDKRYQELLADLSTPLARRMAELEARDDPPEQELGAFLQKLASNPLPAPRIDMIHRLDLASRSSDLVGTVVLTLNKAVLRGMAGAAGKCVSEGQLARAEEAMVQQAEETKDSYTSAMQTALTYTYREVSDSDLSVYVKIYEKDNSTHIHDVVHNALVAEYNDASARMGRSMIKAIRANLAASGNHSCDAVNAVDNGGTQLADAANPNAAAASGVAPAQAQPSGAASAVESEAPKSAIPMQKRKGGDITQCLQAGSDKDIAACAEKYRP